MSAFPSSNDIFDSGRNKAQVQTSLEQFFDATNQRIGDGSGTAAEKAASRSALETTRGLQPITAAVAANALTVTLNPTNLEFRHATLGNGTVNMRTVAAAINLVISSGSTLGTVSGVASRVALLAIDNSGTVELAAVNANGGFHFDESQLITTTAEGGAGAADSAAVVYSTTARSNVPFRFVGYVESTQGTAGTWTTAPSKIQGAGGLVRPPVASMVRLTTANGSGSSSTAIRRFLTTITNQGSDIIYADSASLGSSFTINVAGVYAISYADSFSVSGYVGLSLDSNQLSTSFDSITQSHKLCFSDTQAASSTSSTSWTGYLPAGSVVRPHGLPVVANGSAPGRCMFTIARVA